MAIIAILLFSPAVLGIALTVELEAHKRKVLASAGLTKADI